MQSILCKYIYHVSAFHSKNANISLCQWIFQWPRDFLNSLSVILSVGCSMQSILAISRSTFTKWHYYRPNIYDHIDWLQSSFKVLLVRGAEWSEMNPKSLYMGYIQSPNIVSWWNCSGLNWNEIIKTPDVKWTFDEVLYCLFVATFWLPSPRPDP